jgi:hypothetical protein
MIMLWCFTGDTFGGVFVTDLIIFSILAESSAILKYAEVGLTFIGVCLACMKSIIFNVELVNSFLFIIYISVFLSSKSTYETMGFFF